MRPIKFRGWLVGIKKMFSAEEMTRDQMALLPDGHFANIHSTSTRVSVVYAHEEFVPMQFTGLLDKNGKEIYEGDILVYKDVKMLVVWGDKTASFAVQYNNKWKAAAHKPSIFYKSMIWGASHGEVVGNVWENPELIK